MKINQGDTIENLKSFMYLTNSYGVPPEEYVDLFVDTFKDDIFAESFNRIKEDELNRYWNEHSEVINTGGSEFYKGLVGTSIDDNWYTLGIEDKARVLKEYIEMIIDDKCNKESKDLKKTDSIAVNTSSKVVGQYETEYTDEYFKKQASEIADKISNKTLTVKLESQEDKDNTLENLRNQVANIVDAEKFNRFTFSDKEVEKLLRIAKRDKAVLFVGPPGGGKTVYAKYLAYKLTGDTTSDRIMLVQFSPSTGYGNFMEGLEPNSNGHFEIVKSSCLRLLDKALENPDKLYVMILDEINRCKVMEVIGELLNMIEARGEYIKTNNGLMVTMPDNVIVIATMNQFDASSNELPYALRSRFAEYEITGINIDIKKLVGEDTDASVLNKISTVWKVVLSLNEYIENQKKTSAYNIGPRQFGYGIKTIEDLQDTVETRIIPSLKLVLRSQYENDAILDKINALEEFVNTGEITEECLDE